MNSFGKNFRVQIFGESHGELVGVLLDGIPAGLELTFEDLLPDLARRKSGRKGTTPRKEADAPLIRSGIFNGHATGAPILIEFENGNTRSKDYDALKQTPRPGHADFTAFQKFGGYQDYRGGGHFSGRLTTGVVAAGAVAKKILPDIRIKAQLVEAGGSSDITAAIDRAMQEKDSIGGIVECRVNGLPAGLGEPFFDSFESLIAHMVFAIPATKGVEFGSGFQAARMKGSEHNDNFIDQSGNTETNHAGGINGGITNGNEVIFRVAVKPTSSTSQPQDTLNFKTGEISTLKVEGRHDTCIALRVPVVLEAVTAIVVAELMMEHGKIAKVFNPKERME